MQQFSTRENATAATSRMNSPDSIGMTELAVVVVVVVIAVIALIVLWTILCWCCRCESHRDRNVNDDSYDDIERGSHVPILDLHYHSKKDALKALEKFIEKFKKHVGHVRIITGWGRHSKDGVAVLKPAVRDRLKEMGLRPWCPRDNPGLIRVDLP